MPKMKSHRGASKRFNVHKSGVIKRSSAYKNHKLNGNLKSRKRKRNLRKGNFVAAGFVKTLRTIVAK